MTRITKDSYAVLPVDAIDAMEHTDNSSERNRARKRPEHEALAAAFSRGLTPRPPVENTPVAETKASISAQARAAFANDQDKTAATFGPVHPAIAAYLHNQPKP